MSDLTPGQRAARVYKEYDLEEVCEPTLELEIAAEIRQAEAAAARQAREELFQELMEPSEEMLHAGQNIPGNPPTGKFLNVTVGDVEWGPREIWQAMLRAAKER